VERGEIAAYLNDGFAPDFDVAGGHMADVVRNMANLTPEDRLAIAAYIKALPPGGMTGGNLREARRAARPFVGGQVPRRTAQSRYAAAAPASGALSSAQRHQA
jgi:hypothetical protein